MAPRVSVIIPVYNAGHYLRQCLDSLLRQSFKEIEIICIDDGSSDDSHLILQQIALTDDRIIVISQENAGAGIARNRGLELASGDYVSFLDADDWFHPDMLKLAYQRAISTDADIAIFQATQFDESTGKSTPITWGFKTEWIPRQEPFSYAHAPKHFFQCFMGWAWDKLFKRSFLLEHNLCFPPLHNSEDMAFVFSALALAAKISTVRQPLLTQRTGNSDSLSNSRTQNSLCFYESLLLLKQALLDADIFLPLRNSFANWAQEYTRWNLLTLATEDKKNACQFLRKEGIFRLGIADMTWGNSYHKRRFNHLRSLLSELPEKGIARKIFPWRKRLSDLIKRPILSIIIPVYNVENYLRSCLDSILTQENLQDYEIICINDGSTDSSSSILAEYQRSFPSLVILTQSNQGLSQARNTGLSIAKGKYIGFVDSDDFVNQKMFCSLIRLIESKRVDLAICGTQLEPEDNFPANGIKEFENYLRIKKNKTKRISSKDYNNINCVAWNKIFKRSIIEQFHIRFPKGLLYEDNVFTKKYIIYSRKYTAIASKMYHYRLRTNSLMNAENPCLKNAKDHLLTAFIAYKDIQQSNHLPFWINSFYRYLHLETIHSIESCPASKCGEILSLIRSFLLSCNYLVNKDCISPTHTRFFDSIIKNTQTTDIETIWCQFKKNK